MHRTDGGAGEGEEEAIGEIRGAHAALLHVVLRFDLDLAVRGDLVLDRHQFGAQLFIVRDVTIAGEEPLTSGPRQFCSQIPEALRERRGLADVDASRRQPDLAQSIAHTGADADDVDEDLFRPLVER
jgi:hypothetical protein